jgi:hypothetical protein
LVSPPQDTALNVPGEMPSPTGSSQRPSGEPPAPPDPTADLAMTGVVESNAGLKVLIQNVQTGASAYAGIDDEAFGLRVTRIDAKRVTLARGDSEYTLEMGAKELPEKTTEAAPASRPSATSASAPSAGEQRGPSGPGRRGFGSGDMMRRLDEALRSGRISREQYDSASRRLDDGRRGGSSGRGPGGRRGR